MFSLAISLGNCTEVGLAFSFIDLFYYKYFFLLFSGCRHGVIRRFEVRISISIYIDLNLKRIFYRKYHPTPTLKISYKIITWYTNTFDICEQVKRGGPVTWVICIKHGNEKTFARYFHYCDAEGGPKNTKSPGFDGLIGGQFIKNGIYKDPIVKYKSFPNSNLQELPEDYVKSMNSDYR